MKNILAALCAIALFALAVPVSAQTAPGGRVIANPQQNPTSVEANLAPRYQRLAMGTWLLNALNLTSSGAGVYSNCSTSPGSGLYVTTAPTLSSSLCALYQVAQDDANPIPVNVTPQVAADPTLIALQALQSTTSSPIGPLTPPGSNSVYWLVEAQVNTIDTNSQNLLSVSGSGSRFFQTVNTQRADVFNYQIKSGTPSATPAEPIVDTGFVPIAYVLVPSGTSQITSGMITPGAIFSGFQQANTAVALVPSPSPSPQTGNAAIAGTFSAQTYFGDGSNLSNVNPSFSSCVPQNQGGTGTCSPTGNSAGPSGNIFVSGSFPNQVIDITQNPTFTGTVASNSFTSTLGFHQLGTTTTGFVAYGTLGVASSDVLRYGSSASAGGYTSFGAANDGQVAGIQNSVLGLGNTGTRTLAIDNSGDLGVLSEIKAASAGIAGGIAADGQTPPTNGLAGGVANATSLKITAAGGATTSEPIVFGYNTACPTSTSGLASFTVAGSPAAKFWCEGGLALDGNTTLPATGIIGGAANTSPFLITAAGGSTTTEGFKLAYTGACHAVGDMAFALTVNGTTELLTKCNGNVVATGTVTGTGLQATALTSIACLGTDSSGNIISNTGCVGTGSISSITAGSNIVVTGSGAVTIAVTAAPTFTGLVTANSVNLSGGTVSDCLATDGSNNVTYGVGCLNSLTAGSNIVVGTGPSPNVSTTNAPTFTGTVSAGAVTSAGAVISSGGGVKADTGVAADNQSIPANGFGCGTSSTPCTLLSSTASGLSNNSFVLNTATSQLGNLLKIENNGVSRFSIDANGDVTAAGLISASSTTQGEITLGGGSSSCVTDYGITTSSVESVACPLRSQTAVTGAVPTTVTPVYLNTGVASNSNYHCTTNATFVAGTGSTVTSNFTASTGAVFTTTITSAGVMDNSGGVPVVPSSVTGASISFPTISGRNYSYAVCGV